VLRLSMPAWAHDQIVDTQGTGLFELGARHALDATLTDVCRSVELRSAWPTPCQASFVPSESAPLHATHVVRHQREYRGQSRGG
jgi:hypothetical protein